VESTYAVARNIFGAVADAGVKLSDRWAAGVGLGFIVSSREDSGPASPFIAPDRLVVSGDLGILYRRPNESLILDIRVGWNNETYDIIDTDTFAVTDDVMTPLFEEATLTLTHDERRTFLTLRQTNEVLLRPCLLLRQPDVNGGAFPGTLVFGTGGDRRILRGAGRYCPARIRRHAGRHAA